MDTSVFLLWRQWLGIRFFLRQRLFTGPVDRQFASKRPNTTGRNETHHCFGAQSCKIKSGYFLQTKSQLLMQQKMPPLALCNCLKHVDITGSNVCITFHENKASTVRKQEQHYSFLKNTGYQLVDGPSCPASIGMRNSESNYHSSHEKSRLRARW